MEKKSKIFERIRKVVARIPSGRVTSYGTIAEFLGAKNARLVGFALWGNLDPKIPCHRVVKKDGFLAENYSLGGWSEQKRQLTKEKVTFVAEKQVDMKKHFWQPQ